MLKDALQYSEAAADSRYTHRTREIAATLTLAHSLLELAQQLSRLADVQEGIRWHQGPQ